jgi:hypothetical protein
MQRSEEVGHRLSRHCGGVMPGRNELGSGNDFIEGPLVDQMLGSDAFGRQPALSDPPADGFGIPSDSFRRLRNRQHGL